MPKQSPLVTAELCGFVGPTTADFRLTIVDWTQQEILHSRKA